VWAPVSCICRFHLASIRTLDVLAGLRSYADRRLL